MPALTIPPQTWFKTLDPGSGRVYPRAHGAGFFIPDELPHDGTNYLPFTVDWSVRLSQEAADSSLDLCYLSSQAPDDSAAPGWSVYSDSNYLRIGNGDSTASDYRYQDAHLTPGAALHLALVYDGADLIFYVNGAEDFRRTASPIPRAAAPAGLNDGRGSGLWYSEIANVRQWSKAMTEAEVQEASTTDYPDGTTDLISAYRLDSGDVYEPASIGSEQAWLPDNRMLESVTTAKPDAAKAETPTLTPVEPVVAAVFPLWAGPEEQGTYHGQISGVVTVKGDPAAQRVLAFVRSTGKKVAETTSAADGTYTLTGLNPEVAHYVVALDKNLEYNGVIADNIMPEVPA